MTWFKIDDTFANHPKVKRIPRRARGAVVGVWTLAGTWAAAQLTDGFIPGYMIEDWTDDDTIPDTLVEVGLWEKRRDGYVFHDWADYNPTREEVETRRASEAARKAAARARAAENRGKTRERPAGQDADIPQDTVRTPEGTPDGQNAESALPDPTRPDPYKEQDLAHGDAVSETIELVAPVPPQPDRFPEFWATWPRKDSKADAQRAWTKAIKSTDPEVILAAAHAYADSPHRPERQFVPYGASWLNGRRWEDPAPEGPEERRQAFDPDAHYAWLRAHGSDPSEWAELCGWHGERAARRILEARVAA